MISGAKTVAAGSSPRSEGVATARGDGVCGGEVVALPILRWLRFLSSARTLAEKLADVPGADGAESAPWWFVTARRGRHMAIRFLRARARSRARLPPFHATNKRAPGTIRRVHTRAVPAERHRHRGPHHPRYRPFDSTVFASDMDRTSVWHREPRRQAWRDGMAMATRT